MANIAATVNNVDRIHPENALVDSSIGGMPLVPGCQLPTETLIQVFLETLSMVISDKINDRPTQCRHPTLAIASVCHRWRDIALGIPDLWGYIPINGLKPHDYTGKIKGITKMICTRTKHTKELFLDFTNAFNGEGTSNYAARTSVEAVIFALEAAFGAQDARTTDITIYWPGQEYPTVHLGNIAHWRLNYRLYNLMPYFPIEKPNQVHSVILHLDSMPEPGSIFSCHVLTRPGTLRCHPSPWSSYKPPSCLLPSLQLENRRQFAPSSLTRDSAHPRLVPLGAASLVLVLSPRRPPERPTFLATSITIRNISLLQKCPNLVHFELDFSGPTYREISYTPPWFTTNQHSWFPANPRLQRLSTRLSTIPMFFDTQKSISKGITFLHLTLDAFPWSMTPGDWYLTMDSSGLSTSVQRLELKIIPHISLIREMISKVLMKLTNVSTLSLHGCSMDLVLETLIRHHTLLPALRRLEMVYVVIDPTNVAALLVCCHKLNIGELVFDRCTNITREFCDEVKGKVDRVIVY